MKRVGALALALALALAVLAVNLSVLTTPRAEIAPAPKQRAFGYAQKSGFSIEYFVGEWTTRNTEFGLDVQIDWTLWRDGRLAYLFTVNGVQSEGSSGTWIFEGPFMHEQWQRADGTTGTGRGRLEWLDDNAFRLTIEDNGHAQYRGLSRIYRRKGARSISQALPGELQICSNALRMRAVFIQQMCWQGIDQAVKP